MHLPGNLRYSCAPDNDPEAEIAGLSMRQVHLFNRLPETLSNMWLDSSADMKSLLIGYEKMKASAYDLCYSCSTEEEYLKDMGEYYEQSGLLQYVEPRTPEQFKKALDQVREWMQWERRYFWHDLDKQIYTRQEFRKYARYYYEGIWPFANNVRWMEYALDMIINDDDGQVCFRITPEEFIAVINQVDEYCQKERKGLSLNMFQEYLNLAIYEKTGVKVDTKESVNIRKRFMQAEVDKEAPDYIRESNLHSTISKYALWEVIKDVSKDEEISNEVKSDIDLIIRELATRRFIPRDKNCLMGKSDRKFREDLCHDADLVEERWAIWAQINKMLVVMKDEEHRDTAGNIELAMEVTDFVYDRTESLDAHKKMSVLLSQLQEIELKRLHEKITYCQRIMEMRAISGRL